MLARRVVGRLRDARRHELGHRVRDDLPVRVDRAAHVGQLRRAEVVPAVLVPAHELQPHRRARELRGDRGREAAVVPGRSVAERARALVVLDADVVQRQVRAPPAGWCASCRRPACSPSRARPPRSRPRPRRSGRSACGRCTGTCRSRPPCSRPTRSAASTLPVLAPIRAGAWPAVSEVAHRAVEIAAARDRRRVAVGHLQHGRRLDRVVLLRRDHGEEVVAAQRP